MTGILLSFGGGALLAAVFAVLWRVARGDAEEAQEGRALALANHAATKKDLETAREAGRAVADELRIEVAGRAADEKARQASEGVLLRRIASLNELLKKAQLENPELIDDRFEAAFKKKETTP